MDRSALKLNTSFDWDRNYEYYEKALYSEALNQFDYNLFRVFNNPTYSSLELNNSRRESVSSKYHSKLNDDIAYDEEDLQDFTELVDSIYFEISNSSLPRKKKFLCFVYLFYQLLLTDLVKLYHPKDNLVYDLMLEEFLEARSKNPNLNIWTIMVYDLVKQSDLRDGKQIFLKTIGELK